MMSDTFDPVTVPWQSMNLTGRMENIQHALKGQKGSSEGNNSRQLKHAASELESIFVYQLLKELRSTVPKSGFISGGKAEELYSSMLDIHLAKELSEKGGIGLSEILLKQLGGTPEDDDERITKNE